MKFIAHIDVMPHEALLDPQGKAVQGGLANLGFSAVSNVRIGKHILLAFEADSREAAEAQVDNACKTLLSNPIMESFQYTLEQA